eukprot:GHVU01130655.1.p1 GENE.GHVU01130655.1~~GHVU01130655.1.p1  ORF type:complete len:142 (+),score=13.51 GHVU01130655.1:899-1324(+)
MEAPTPPLPPLDAVNVNGGTSGRGEAALLTPSSPPPAALSGPHLCPSFPRLRLQRRGGAAAPSLAADLYTKASEARGQISGGNKSNLQVSISCARHPLSWAFAMRNRSQAHAAVWEVKPNTSLSAVVACHYEKVVRMNACS